ncbi:peptidoglycan-binding protein LysM [Flavicella sediminum]|uniref:peptidoglycan-binding protein LysM n=1 Tax=Flavicella sediminum TaxID=2585141 RepID=UPI00111DA3E1|nr:peptidoglycan-binding protein LysM [Flavicella sediminum]
MESIRKKSFLSVAFGLGICTMYASSLFSKNPEETIASVLTEEEAITNFAPPYAKHEFDDFKEALAFKESQGNYLVVNKLGYLGKYQFGRTTLERFKIYDTNEFLKDPELQEKAFLALCAVNKWILRKDIRRSVGKKINGILITESGILAAAHLAGAGNVKKFLRSQGQNGFADAFGTTVASYLELFAAYDTSDIVADRMPIVTV